MRLIHTADREGAECLSVHTAAGAVTATVKFLREQSLSMAEGVCGIVDDKVILCLLVS